MSQENVMSYCRKKIWKITSFKLKYIKSKKCTKYFTASIVQIYVIHLMECILCNEQYIRKAETTFNPVLNNHIKT